MACRVCLKRPEIPDERYGRCEPCAKGGRIALRFRLGPGRDGSGLVVKAGELSPRALKQKWQAPLQKYAGTPAAKSHLGLHEIEMVVAKDRLETIRVAQDLAGREGPALEALRAAAERSDGSW